MATLKSGKFWIGVVVGAVVVPMAMAKFAPGMKAKIPGMGSAPSAE